MEIKKIKFRVIDKSIAQRAVIIRGLFFGERVKLDFGDGVIGDDVRAAIKCVKEIKEGKQKIYAGNSATVLRLIAGAAAGLGLELEIEGDESLNNRCMRELVSVLERMGARVFGEERNGKVLPPIKVNSGGELRAISFENKSLSAQVKSAVLLAGFNLSEKSIVNERIKTRNHTELMLEYLGGISKNKNIILKIPYDISAAAFLIALGLLKGEQHIEIDGIGINSTRLGFIEILQKAGFDIKVEETGFYGLEKVGKIIAKSFICCSSKRGRQFRPIFIDKNNLVGVIDEIPILCAAASFIDGESVFKDLRALRNKESDRVQEIYEMLKNFGVMIEMKGDELRINGGFARLKTNRPLIVSKDHRIIMAASVVGELMGGYEVLHPEYVGISYPNFFEDIRLL